MSIKRILSADGGILREWIREDDGTTIIKSSMDAGPTLDANKVAQTDDWGANYKNGSRGRDVMPVACIPPMTWYGDMRDKGIVQWSPGKGEKVDQKKLKAYLNDPDNRHLRTWPGRL